MALMSFSQVESALDQGIVLEQRVNLHQALGGSLEG